MEKLVTDVTEFKVAGGKAYLSPVMDLYNNEIVAWSVSRSPIGNIGIDLLFERIEGVEGAMPVELVLQGKPCRLDFERQGFFVANRRKSQR